MFDRLTFIISEAMVSLRRNGLLTLAAVVTVSVSLLLLGGFGYLYYRVDTYAQSLPNQFEMRIFTKDEVSGKALHLLAQKLREEPGVASVHLIPKALAWKKMKLDQPEIPAELTNPLPNAFNVKFNSLAYAGSAAKEIKGWPETDKVLYQADLLKSLQQGMGLLRYIGYIGLLLFAIGGIIIYNAIRFTVIARRTEIRIMQLVGASYATVRAPFMIEGVVQGACGGLLAAIMLYFINRGVTGYITQIGLSVPTFPSHPIFLWLSLSGAAFGLVCSGVAIRVPLKYR